MGDGDLVRDAREPEIRAALHEWIRARHGETPGGVVVLDEFGSLELSTRMDVASVTVEALSGFEIKSHGDSIRRLLEHQGMLYEMVCDLCWVVAPAGHLAKASAWAGHWWGLLELVEREGALGLRVEREATESPHQAPGQVLSQLWKGELLEVLTMFGHDRGVRSKGKAALVARACERFSLAEACYATRRMLMERARKEKLA